MGRFCALVVVLVAACGDNLEGADEQHPSSTFEIIESTPQARVVPSVCGERAWLAPMDPSSQLSVASRPEGATMLAVPTAGGVMSGVVFDTRMNMVTMGKVTIDTAFTSVTSSFVENHIVATAIADGSMQLHMLDDNLGNPQYIANLPGTHLAEPAFFHVKTDLVMPLAGDDGLWLHRFADSFEPLDSRRLLQTNPARSLAAAQFGNNVLAAWATDSECYLMLTDLLAQGPTRRIATACPNPRIAVDQQLQRGIMVFDGDGGVRLMTFNGMQFGGDAPLVREATHSPRAVFDGQRFWLSFIDLRGEVIVGFLDADGQAVTMSLQGPKPQYGAYDLVMIDGAPWVIAIEADGYTASRMCVTTEGQTELTRGGGTIMPPTDLAEPI